MIITFLVGNGFDVATGLKTGYNSFYEWYCALPSDNDSNDVKHFKENIQEYIDRVHNNEDLDDETWADFERGLGTYTSNFSEDKGNDFLECREDAFNKIIDYLTMEQNKFDIETLSENDVTRVRTELGNFYMELHPNEQRNIKHLFDITKSENASIKFISFNYTNILDQVVQKISEAPICNWTYGTTRMSYKIDPTVLHVHGKLDEYPILAVNDESQIENRELFSTVGFRESMIKEAGVQAVGRSWYESGTSTINSSRIVCIWGMSLGATDKTWWEKIVTWLNGNEARRLIIFQHLETSINKRSITQYVRNKNVVVDKLLSYSTLPEENKRRLKDRIYVAFNAAHVLHLKDDSSALALV